MKNYIEKIINFPKQVYINCKRKYRKIKLSKIINSSTPIKINIGAGEDYYDNWHSLQISDLNLLIEEDWEILFRRNSISNILAEHVWEHLSMKDARVANKNCFNYLKSGGRIRIAVPDGFFPNQEYIDNVKPGGNGLGSEDHKILYDYRMLAKELKSVGFEVFLLEYWDENGKFHFNDWKKKEGHIRRSMRFDRRNNNNNNLRYTSLIIDGVKP